MSSSNRQPIDHRSTATTLTTRNYPYFLIVMTNYPNLFRRETTHAYQPSSVQYGDGWQQQQQWHQQGVGNRSGMFIPGVRVHFGSVYTNAHQRLLYNTLRFQLEQIMHAYLFQTHQLHPIYFVFDMSHLNFQF